MTARPIALCLAAAVTATAPFFTAAANEFTPQIEALVDAELKALLSDPALIAAIRDQNARSTGLDQAAIDALDLQWRAQVGKAPAPLIDAVVGSVASDRLRAAQEASGGLYSEIFLMDQVGLNVAASATTSDYWQGDEAKWQQTFGAGGTAIHISEVELDESTQTYQSQVSLPVIDPETGIAIGAATFGVNIELLP